MECLAIFGKDLGIDIRRRDGKIVRLNFICPSLARTPMKFYGTRKFLDPLAIRD